MAVSPADFYAYSRATGAPVPEDLAERMQMAPEVMEFRRNQLRSPQRQEEKGADPLSVGLGVGLALAGGVGAALGARRLFGGRKVAANAGVRQANLAEMAAEASPVRQVAQETQPRPSQAPPQIVEQEFVAYRPDPKEMVSRPVAEARRQSATEGLLKAAEARRGTYQPDIPGTQATLLELRSPLLDETAGLIEPQAPSRPLSIAPQQQSIFNPRSYIEQTGAVAPAEDLTSLQQRNNLQVVDQNINAVESGEDQMTGRVRQQLQRNEDLNLSSVDALEDQTNSIDFAAAQTSDGLPFDQAEGQSSAARFMQRERDEIASQLGEQGLPITSSRIEQELANRVSGSEAWKYGPKYTQRKQALQLGATYEPKFFENLKTPSVQIAGETIPVEALKEPVAMQETAQRLQERVASKRDWLGQVRLEEQKNKVRLMNVEKNIDQLQGYQNEVSNFLSSSKASPEQLRRGKQTLSDLTLDLDRLGTQQAELSHRVYGGEKRIQGARSSVKQSISELQLPQKLKSGIEEGQRIFFETDSSGQVIPETMGLRSERRMVDLPAKGGGGRNVAEYTAGERLDEEIRAIQGGGRIRDYDPETGMAAQRWQPDTTQSGRDIDIYGIRPSSEARADPEMRPSEPGSSRTPLTQELTPERLASVELSEQARKTKNPQDFLQQEMQKRGISAIGEFSPWPRRNR